MSQSQKPGAREFKLHFFYGSARVELASEQAFILNEETILVIEKSAYDAVVAERDALRDSIGSTGFDNERSETLREIDLLRTECDKLRTERDKWKERYKKSETDYQEIGKDYDKLEDKFAKAKVVLEFYASALGVDESKSPFGEPNEDPQLMPARLGTRASRVLKEISDEN